MCWLTYKEENSKCKVATEDIPIYKILHTTLQSIYRFHEYSLNKVYNETMVTHAYRINVSTYSVTLGYHSYSPEMTYIKCGLNGVFWVCESKGTRLDTFTYNMIRVNGFIPKGSHYFLNEKGEYVSDSIVLTEVVWKNIV